MPTGYTDIWIGCWQVALRDTAVRLTGSVFRAHNPEWAWRPASGEGARLHGGRFSRIGRAALYTSLRAVTAIREASPLGQPMQPLTLCQYEVDCERIFDSRNPTALASEQVNRNDLNCPSWELDMLKGKIPSSQALADSLIAKGYYGMVVRSFARGAMNEDINVVFWNWSDVPPNQVRVIDTQGRLPRDQSSWL